MIRFLFLNNELFRFKSVFSGCKEKEYMITIPDSSLRFCCIKQWICNWYANKLTGTYSPVTLFVIRELTISELTSEFYKRVYPRFTNINLLVSHRFEYWSTADSPIDLDRYLSEQQVWLYWPLESSSTAARFSLHSVLLTSDNVLLIAWCGWYYNGQCFQMIYFIYQIPSLFL